MRGPGPEPSPNPPAMSAPGAGVDPAVLCDLIDRVLAAISDAAVVIDPTGTIQTANSEALQVLGYERAELLGKPLAVVFGESALSPEALGELTRPSGTTRVAKTCVAKNGAKIAVSLSSLTVPDPQGKGPTVLCLARSAAEAESLAARIAEERQQVTWERENLEEARRQLEEDRERLLKEQTEAKTEAKAGGPPAVGAPSGEAASAPKAELWQWAEDELKRVRASLQRSQQKVMQLEDDLASAVQARETAERRRGQIEEELLHAQEEVQRAKDQLTRRPPEPAGDATRRAEAERRRLTMQLQQTQTAHEQVQEQLRQVQTERERQAERLLQGQRDREALEERLRKAEAEQQRLAAELEARRAAPPPVPSAAGPSPPAVPTAAPALSAVPPAGDLPLLDRAAALAGVDGDVDFLRALVGVFLDNCPRQIAEIRAAVERGDAPALESAARMLKGTVGNFGAKAAGAAAARVESLAGSGDLAGAARACVELDEELERLKPALAALREENAA